MNENVPDTTAASATTTTVTETPADPTPASPPSANPFKVGDLCQLKSGGPEMTVGGVSGDLVFAMWFDYSPDDGKFGEPRSFQVDYRVLDGLIVDE